MRMRLSEGALCTIVAAVAIVAIAPGAEGAQRMVLGEYFTATW